jgi:hypothetical protein
MTFNCGKGCKCGAGAAAREKLRSTTGFMYGDFERARLQPGRSGARRSRALAPEGGRYQ